MSERYDLCVIGAGPGGYVAAIKAAQAGLNVACVEREPMLGGTCLRVGCIPSKALLEASEKFNEARSSLADYGVELGGVRLDLLSMMARKDQIVKTMGQGIDALFAKNKITRIKGTGTLVAADQVEVQGEQPQTIHAERVLLATGSRPASLPGIELDGDRIGDSTAALAYKEVPEHLVLIGAGVIGLELGSVWRRLGARVTVLEYQDHILPGMDLELSRAAQKLFGRQGLSFRMNSRVTGASLQGDGRCLVTVDGADPLDCDRVLVAVGRVPNSDNLGLEALGVATDKRGVVQVDGHYRTSVEGVYAIGDLIPGPMLAHKAEDEAAAVVEGITRGYSHVNYNAIPSVVYTHPELASVGQTEEQLTEAGVAYKAGRFPFKANARAHAMHDTDGFAKVLAHAETDRILGVHIIGPRAGDLIAEAVTAMEFGATAEDLARVCHAHPTLAEVVKEAALGAWDKPIHM